MSSERPDHDAAAARALAPAPISPARTQWRTFLVAIFAVGFTTEFIAVMWYGLTSTADTDLPLSLTALPIALNPAILAAALASDRVLADWLTPDDERQGRAFYLSPIGTLTAARWAWGLWWVTYLAIWLLGGLALGGIGGAFAGVGIGVLAVIGLMAGGLCVAWLIVLPVGLLVGLLARRRRDAQTAVLGLVSLLIISILVLSVPAAWTRAPESSGSIGYLRAVLGLDGAFDQTQAALWVARLGLLLLLITLPLLLVAFRRFPQQRAAGRAMQEWQRF